MLYAIFVFSSAHIFTRPHIATWLAILMIACAVPAPPRAECASERGSVLLQHHSSMRIAAKHVPEEATGLTSEQRSLMCFLKKFVPLPLQLEGQGDILEKVSFSRCAVVSNSGALKNRTHGLEIDNHSAVFRFNTAPVQGFELHVGSKDTVRVINGPVMRLFRGDSELLQQVVNASEIMLFTASHPAARDLSQHAAAFRLIGPNVTDVPRLKQRFVLAMQELFSPRWIQNPWRSGKTLAHQHLLPSTGAMGMLVALSLCNHIHAYDMTPTEASQDAPYHYFDGAFRRKGSRVWQREKGTPRHASNMHGTWNAEHELWLRLTTTPVEVAKKTGVTEFVGLSTVACDAQHG